MIHFFEFGWNVVAIQSKMAAERLGEDAPVDVSENTANSTNSPSSPTFSGLTELTDPALLFPGGPSLREAKSATELLQRLDAIFGGGYFERGELVITAVRDLQGVAKVAHKVQSRLLSEFGDVVEVKPEFIKEEEYRKPKFRDVAAEQVDCRELELPNICSIPEGARIHPYLRPRLPTLEILLLWRCQETGAMRSHTVLGMEYPNVPKDEDVPRIFAEVEPYFKKRWIHIELRMGGALIEGPNEASQAAEEQGAGEATETAATGGEGNNGDGNNGDSDGSTAASAGLAVEVLACHPVGFAKDSGGFGDDPATPVNQCDPLVFRGISDDRGVVKICVLPAPMNKVRVPECDNYYSGYRELPLASLTAMGQGVTKVPLILAPKAEASVKVKVFVRPPMIPIEADIGDSENACVDWEMCERAPLTEASVSLQPFDAPVVSIILTQEDPENDPGTYVISSLTEGMADLTVSCPGYQPCTQPLMILVGENVFYIPLTPE